MKLGASLFLLLAVVPLMAADPPGFVIWPKGVPPADLNGKLDFGNHALSISHRDKNGVVEVHEKLVDVFVVQSGEATLVVGGEVAGPRTTGPGEIQGDSIKGGVSKKVAAGDVIHIPAGVPHQFFLDQGKQITYFVVKVAAQ
jgi:mannose-6-phosphate isomerase-like protein (cupin superfamily)